MNQIRKTALIAGASGLVGSELLKKLLDNNNYSMIYSVVRKPSGLNHSKLNELVVDFSNLSEELNKIDHVDDVFCCLGTTIKVAGSKEAFKTVDYFYPLILAKWAEHKKSSRFLMITAMGADSKSSIFYNRVKGEAENDISKLALPSVTFFRPSLLIGNRKESRAGEKLAIVFFKAISFLFIGPLKNYKGIHVSKVAEAMMQAAQNAKTGKEVILSGSMQ